MREPTREHQYEKVLCALLAQYRALQKDVRELRASVDALRFLVPLEKFLTVSQSACFHDTALSHLFISLTS